MYFPQGFHSRLDTTWNGFFPFSSICWTFPPLHDIHSNCNIKNQPTILLSTNFFFAIPFKPFKRQSNTRGSTWTEQENVPSTRNQQENQGYVTIINITSIQERDSQLWLMWDTRNSQMAKKDPGSTGLSWITTELQLTWKDSQINIHFTYHFIFEPVDATLQGHPPKK